MPPERLAELEGGVQKLQLRPPARWTRSALRVISITALWIAIGGAVVLILSHAISSLIGLQPPFPLKSGIPLIAIGTSYISLMLTLPRRPGQMLVGVLMGLAFVLWGLEQFLVNRALICFIDDCVAFLFITDLSIIIRQNHRQQTLQNTES